MKSIKTSSQVISRHKKDWEELGQLDPLWAILNNSDKKYGKWDIDDFFETGKIEINDLISKAKNYRLPFSNERSLDFGCGVGRLTRYLANYFEESYGVDISEPMIAKAKQLNKELKNCKFILNLEPNLKIFSPNFFDLIYTNIVLQHMPKPALILSYVSEFIRILKKNGLIIFQLPSYIPFKKRIQPRRRLYNLLRFLGLNERTLYNKLGLYPMRMTFIPINEISAFILKCGGKLIEIEDNLNCGPFIQSKTYYVTKN